MQRIQENLEGIEEKSKKQVFCSSQNRRRYIGCRLCFHCTYCITSVCDRPHTSWISK